jgi:transposase-like protein
VNSDWVAERQPLYLVDESQIPRIALREILANALIHRSYSELMESTPVTVELSDLAVVISSPGGIHVAAHPTTLGLSSTAGVRNRTLVRVAELLKTPSGGRITELQGLGIRAADKACRRMGTMPALFADRPASFQAVFLRGTLDSEGFRRPLQAHGITTEPALRLVAAASRLEELEAMPGLGFLRTVVLDSRFVARVLSPAEPEDAAFVIKQLEGVGVLRRISGRGTAAWRLSDQIAADNQDGAVEERRAARGRSKSKRDRLPELLRSIHASADGELRAKDIGQALDLASPTSRNRWIRRAEETGLIEPTKESPFDPEQAYRLTAKGVAVLSRGE